MDVSSYLLWKSLPYFTIEVRGRKDCRLYSDSGKPRRVNQEHINNIHQTNCLARTSAWVFFPLWVFSGCPLEESFLPWTPCLRCCRTHGKTEIKRAAVMLLPHKGLKDVRANHPQAKKESRWLLCSQILIKQL